LPRTPKSTKPAELSTDVVPVSDEMGMEVERVVGRDLMVVGEEFGLGPGESIRWPLPPEGPPSKYIYGQPMSYDPEIWNSEGIYGRYTVVLHNGTTFIAAVQNTGQEPSSKSAVWQELGKIEINPEELPASVLTSGQGNLIPLKQFGAKWEAGHDSTKALEEAIVAQQATGGVILLPDGEGEINGEPKIPKNLTRRIVIRGAGEGNTIVKLTSAKCMLSYATTEPGDTVGNVEVTDLAINGNNQTGNGSAIIQQTNECREQVNVVNVRVRRVRVFNVPGPATATNRAALLIQSYHPFPGLALSRIENIDIGQVTIEGCQQGVTIMGESTQTPFPVNIRMRHILIEDILHEAPAVATEDHNCAHVQVGQNAWTDQPETIVVQRIRGVNSSDTGVELDVPCVFRDIFVTNSYNEFMLLNTFNPCTTGSPVITKTTAIAAIGATSITASSTGFIAGQQITLINGISTSETRTISAIPDGAHLEVTEALQTEWAVGKWIVQVQDMDAAAWKGANLHSYHTTEMANGNNRGFVVQNAQNVIPMPGISIDGLHLNDTSTALPALFVAQTGTTKSKTGAPRYLRIRNLKVNKKNAEYAGGGLAIYTPVTLEMRGPHTPVEIQGEVSVEGPGVTGAGKIQGRSVNFSSTIAIADLDIVNRIKLKSLGGEKWYGIGLNQATAGDLRGRIRHRWLTSKIEEAGGLASMIFGKGCAFSSLTPTTTLTAAAAAEAVTLEVESTEGFTEGQALVVDSESTSKPEIFIISEVKEGEKKIVVVSAGNKPGMGVEHAIGASVSLLRGFEVVDCDNSALSSGTGMMIEFEDSRTAYRTMVRGFILRAPEAPETLTPAESTKATLLTLKGRPGVLSVVGGTVTLIESSPDGKRFYKVSGGTNVQWHVSPGDAYKMTDAVAPTVTFIPDRA
jgi:hypothetical protein